MGPQCAIFGSSRRLPGGSQVEAVKLAAESRTLAMEAELAAARRDAAQASSALKSATASWHSELDWQKAEVCAPLDRTSCKKIVDFCTHVESIAAPYCAFPSYSYNTPQP